MSRDWLKRLEADHIILLDGGTGTELQRRGVPMDEATWSGAGMHTHARVVREVHEDYIRAGAEVIVTNTFATTRQMLEGAGLGDEVRAINRRAVEVAIEARESTAKKSVAIAGSISAMPAHFDRSAFPNPEDELEVYRELAGILGDAGVDLIALEMMEEPVHAPLAMRAALETGLPVWLGLSCRRHPEHGGLVAFDHHQLDFAVVLDTLIPMAPTVVNLMHCEIESVDDALKLVRERWRGPIGVYPESGYFTKPNWSFVDVVSPQDLVAEALTWVASGVRLLGGCCGTGPEHVQALRDAKPALEAARSAG